MMLSLRPRRSLRSMALTPPAAAPSVNTDCGETRRGISVGPSSLPAHPLALSPQP